MTLRSYNRRDAMLAGGSAAAGVWLPRHVLAKDSRYAEVDLADEPSRGEYGVYDVANFGPPPQRNVKKDFVYPRDVDVPSGYGIDVSHHSREVPWDGLKAAKVNYVYIKASQSRNGRDGKFEEFWKNAEKSGLPFGAYHFLTAGVPGRDQGSYFFSRLSRVGGLRKGHLQPVIDLEWDTFGPDFKRTVVGTTPQGDKVYRDYWDSVGRSAIVATVNDCVASIRAAAGKMSIKPIIYTNRSWWDLHIPAATVFSNCTIWISDYRQQSFDNNSPRSVQGHDYYLWQFTDRASINVAGKSYGPYDSNKLLFGGVDKITIA